MATSLPRVRRAFTHVVGACIVGSATFAACTQSTASQDDSSDQVDNGTSGDIAGASSGTSESAGAGQGGAGTTGGVASAGSAGTAAHGGGAGSATAGTMMLGLDAGRPARTKPLRIMPFGDSITTSTCYRAKLAQVLDMNHKGDYDFVGTQKGGCDSIKYDNDNEGHGGYLITQHTADFAGWANANTIDVLLLHFATNDNWNSIPPAKILDAYTLAVGEFRKHNPYVVILVAQLIPLFPMGCTLCPINVQNFNATIPGWAAKTTTAMSPVIVVDQWTGYDAIADNRDGVHPNDTTGSVKMATKWAEALEPLF
jgi:hypothetical protein